MKILSIGNSFSQDAHKWLHKLAKQNGCDLSTCNLYIGGCPLDRHFRNLKGDYYGRTIRRNYCTGAGKGV